MKKSILIIGAGLGGLAAGVYGQLNGYNTLVCEQHLLPGGQCASWKRKGYTFDGCIHHLFGCSSFSRINQLWRELGTMPRELAATRECVAVASPDGKLFTDFWDIKALEEHLKLLSPADAPVIDDYLKGIQVLARKDVFGTAMLGSPLEITGTLPILLRAVKWARLSMQAYADRFSDPFLRRAFSLLEYSVTDIPFILHLAKHAHGLRGDIAWPVGGSLAFARSLEQRYLDLGGEISYRRRASEIVTRDGRATGARFEDGSEERADVVISNADGRKTIMQLLGGRFTDENIRRFCDPPADETPWAVHVFLGVKGDLPTEPSALVMLLDEPVTIAGHTLDSLEMQIFGPGTGMAPEGGSIIKVELVSRWSYWKKLSNDRALYENEKQRVAEAVLDLLERRWPGLRTRVEVIDVPTLLTWERYVGGTQGFMSGPGGKLSLGGTIGRGLHDTLPGLAGFYLVGTFATGAGALFSNALSGRNVMRTICHADGRDFNTV